MACGENEDNSFMGLAIDQTGNIYLDSQSYSSDFPVTNGAFDTSYNGGYKDGIIVKFDSNLQNLLASTYLGGNEGDVCSTISIGNDGSVYVAGITGSSNFPATPNAYDTSFEMHEYGGRDAFISKFDSDLSKLMADINGDGKLDITDAIFGMQIISASDSDLSVSADSDVNGDGKIGMEEEVYILQKISDLR